MIGSSPMAGTKQEGIFGLIYQLVFAGLFALGGITITYAWARGSKGASPFGIVLLGFGIWMLLRAVRSRRSSESQAVVRSVSNHLGDVLPLPGRMADYRTSGRARPSARALYAEVLSSAPFPADATRPGRVLPFALGATLDISGTVGLLAGGVVFTAIPLMFAILLRRSAAVILPLLLVLVGIALIMSAVRKLLSRTKLPVVEVSDEPLYLGDTLRVHVEQRGPAKVTRMQVGLSCRERATSGVGTSTRTEEHEVLCLTLLDDREIFSVASGQHKAHDLEVVVPRDAPASFRAKKNNVAWLLRVQAEITGWPDYDELYEIRVVPAPPL